MTEPAKKDDLLDKLGIDMDDVKAKLAELREKGKKLSAEAKQDLERTLKELEPKQKQLEAKLGEWAKAGKMAGAEVAKGLEGAAKELKKGVDAAIASLKR
jgi:predicted  nucleic acid-binding Zn-ribbon protein